MSDNTPPRNIPDDLYNDYTLSGKIPIQDYWLNNTRSTPLHITGEIYEKTLRAIEEGTFSYYGNEHRQIAAAFEDYPVEGKDVLVWGLAGCNCDALMLFGKAKRVFVVEYNTPVCDHPAVTVLTHEQLFQSSLQFDAMISYSSFEHDGLGRYGDSLDPYGDCKAMQKARKFLKEDGVFFLAVPVGKDCLAWNAHRIYGEIRLPMLLSRFAVLDVYSLRKDVFAGRIGKNAQPLLVLKKLPHGREAAKKNFLDSLRRAKSLMKLPEGSLRDGDILRQITEFQIKAL